MRFRIALPAILGLISISMCIEARTVIRVRSQSDFDTAAHKVTAAAKNGETQIYVRLSPGTYVARDLQFELLDLSCPDLALHIIGRRAVIIPDGAEYKDGDVYQGVFDVDRSWLGESNDVTVWSGVKYADGPVEILNEQNKDCRIKASEPLPAVVGNNSFILIPHWFRSSVYRIDRIESGYIYFNAPDLSLSFAGGYNVNDDINYGGNGSCIRYKLCNVVPEDGCLCVCDGVIHLPAGVPSVREGSACRVFSICRNRFKSLEIKGLEFRGNGFSDISGAIKFISNDCPQVSVVSCSFIGLRSTCIVIEASSNVKVSGNKFRDCWRTGILSENGCLNTTVSDNVFSDMGKQMQNTFCVICRGENYRVSGNTMTDFGYGGIGVGVWYKADKRSPCSGSVEMNRMSFTPGYTSSIDNYGIMDSGAIYVWTQNDSVIIRGNRIDGYLGMKDNRGIFCDDGASNVMVFGNTITGILNSYSIDSRRVREVESSPGSKVVRANVNNRVYGNTVNAPIRFEPREGDDNGCYIGENTVKKL